MACAWAVDEFETVHGATWLPWEPFRELFLPNLDLLAAVTAAALPVVLALRWLDARRAPRAGASELRACDD